MRAVRGGGAARRNDRGGFTLLETIVSFSILAVIAASIALTFRLAAASIERGEDEARGMARLRAGIGILTRAIRSADPTGIPMDNGTSLPYFSGERGRLRFLSAAPSSAVAGGGFRLLSFHEGADARGGGLALTEASPFRAEGAEGWESAGAARVFLRGVTDVAFSFSPGPAEGGAWEWLEAWDTAEAGSLPAAVRVEFTMPSERGPLKTAFVVPVPAGGGER